jgi:hypothetical protein
VAAAACCPLQVPQRLVQFECNEFLARWKLRTIFHPQRHDRLRSVAQIVAGEQPVPTGVGFLIRLLEGIATHIECIRRMHSHEWLEPAHRPPASLLHEPGLLIARADREDATGFADVEKWFNRLSLVSTYQAW